MNWQLICACGNEVQVFVASGDPQSAALQLFRDYDWLKGFTLVAAVEGDAKVLVADSARSDECGLQ